MVSRVVPALLLGSLLAACGGVQSVQLYDGAKLPDAEVTVLLTNPRLEMDIDRQHKVTADERTKLHRLELPAGNHAVEVRCLYQDAQNTVSPVIALALEG